MGAFYLEKRMEEKNMSQAQMVSLRGKAYGVKSRDEVMRDILIALMIAVAVSFLLSYLPMILDATSKAKTSNSSGGTISTVVNKLSQGVYEEVVGVARPVAVVALGIYGVTHFGYPGSKLDKLLQGWPTRIIMAFCIIALAPTILDWLESTLTDNGLFTWKS